MTLELSSGRSEMYCSDDFFYLLTNASNASWNETIYEWEADCDTTKAKNIILNIGSNGNTSDADTKQLVLTGADYIKYLSYYDTCVVYANHYKYIRYVQLKAMFLNNHCLAYNIKEITIGFADTKSIKSQLRNSKCVF
ncbi:hypothetical protein DdX_19369 [Ditylenchus destructor]|uniref:Uncharacterized protein n=1 Tax=Ditylenchus destructor TaxID=166010 RepID=A0AAD4MJJ1_9BILA|nr:hypothetical protein DdX_19369 [Ditylenchus destructor]